MLEHMKRLQIPAIAMACVAAALPGYARQLTVDQALSALNANRPATLKAAGMASSTYTLAHTVKANDLNTIYVLNDDDKNGYLILSADDVATPLLGFAETGAFEKEEMSPSMKAWLEQYSRQIAYAAENGLEVESYNAGYDAVAPLMTTLWDQTAPYNNDCPTINGKSTYTGCLATAMAQVINYHKYPEQGTGNVSYSWNNTTLSYYFTDPSNKFDYSQMADNYSVSTTAQQKAAVANLMYACGIAVHMNYNSSASSAQSIMAPQSLYNNFNYDKSIRYTLRDLYTLDVWTDMIYNELKESRPVIYGGLNSQNGGHAFVVDGYENGYFHLNWGWSGLSNGYFLITALDPDIQGAGGSSSGYNYDQDACLNVQPPKEGSDFYPGSFISGNFGPEGTYAYSRSIRVNFLSTGQYEGWLSTSVVPIDFDFALKVTDSEGNVQYIYLEETYRISPFVGYNQVMYPTTAFQDLPQGTYTVTPATSVNGKMYDIPVYINQSRAVSMTVGPDNVTFERIFSKAELKATDIKPVSSLYRGKIARISAKISNSGEEYLGAVYPVIRKPGSKANSANFSSVAVQVDVTANSSVDVEWLPTLPSTLLAGDYEMFILDDKGNVISDATPITVSTAPTEAQGFKITKLQFPYVISGAGSMFSPYYVGSQDFTVNATIECTSGYLTDMIVGFVFPLNGQGSAASLIFPQLTLDAGQSETVKLSAVLSSLSTTETYYLMVMDYTTQTWDPNQTRTFFRIGGLTGVEEVEADQTVKIYPNPVESTFNVSSSSRIMNITAYSMTGAAVLNATFSGESESETVDASTLPAGTYLVKVETENGIMVDRIIKK